MSIWEHTYVYVKDRQGGKTTWLLDQVHNLVVAGRGSEVLIVVSNTRMIEYTKKAWRSRFPALRMPDIIALTNTIGTRGRRYSKIFVDDIEVSPYGWADDKISDLLPCLVWADDPEVFFTASPYEPFPDPPTKQELAAIDAERRRRVRAQRKAMQDNLAIAHMLATIAIAESEQ